jgi:2-polyprenyl-3-methyl-5-hydroxy-6-metoxy-1,4-benzoquinol methylase
MRRLKSGFLAAVSGATGRPAILLSPEAAREDDIIRLQTRYRVDQDAMSLTIHEPDGHLVAALQLGDERQPVWTSPEMVCAPDAVLSLSLTDGSVCFKGERVGSVTGGTPLEARRLSWLLTVALPNGRRKKRRTGHYVARNPSHDVGENYFAGEDYLDYEEQSASVHDHVLGLVRAHGMTGPVLEIGCATGGTLARLHDAGLDGVGVDFSQWAVTQAERRLGPDLVHWCDVERHGLPEAVRARAPFGSVVMASVFEHFSRPYDVLAMVGEHVRRGGHLIVLTTNADSLTHRIFGSDWEGYFDWTHKGVDEVSAASVRRNLPTLGWSIQALRTWHVWDGDADPTKATLREWVDADARFRRLLEERDLGDFLECVAIRT